MLPVLHSIYRWLPQELAFLTASFFQQLDSPIAISDFHVSFFSDNENKESRWHIAKTGTNQY